MSTADALRQTSAQAMEDVVARTHEQDQRIEELSNNLKSLTTEFRNFARRRSTVAKKRFEALLAQWKRERGPKAFIATLSMHPAYQQIIGLGEDAVPFLLAEFERAPGHYDWALRAITGEDPVPRESRGKLQEMAQIWIKWGKDNGYEW